MLRSRVIVSAVSSVVSVLLIGSAILAKTRKNKVIGNVKCVSLGIANKGRC